MFRVELSCWFFEWLEGSVYFRPAFNKPICRSSETDCQGKVFMKLGLGLRHASGHCVEHEDVFWFLFIYIFSFLFLVLLLLLLLHYLAFASPRTISRCHGRRRGATTRFQRGGTLAMLEVAFRSLSSCNIEPSEKTQYTTVIHNNIIYKLYLYLYLYYIHHTYTYKDIQRNLSYKEDVDFLSCFAW